MNLSDIIESGQIECYIFGLMDNSEQTSFEALMEQYPDLAAYVRQSEAALANYALQYARKPASELKHKILAHLKDSWAADNLVQSNELPLLTRNPDIEFWRKATAGIEHPKFDNIHLHTLRKDDTVEISLVWLSGLVPDEHHDDLIESFLILEGVCSCLVGDEEVVLQAGDYLEMPLHMEHNVRAISQQPVKAVLQWLKIAA